jgi:hypothetical protein
VPPLPGDVGQPPTVPPAPAPPPTPPAPPPADDAAELRATLERERARTRDVERQLAELQRQGMTQTQRQIEDARNEGRQAAIKEAGTRVAVEAFRTAAKGRLADAAAIEAALEALDLTRFVKDDGTIDRDGIARLVDKLTPPAPSGPQIPAGPHGGAPADGDFLRQALQRGGR